MYYTLTVYDKQTPIIIIFVIITVALQNRLVGPNYKHSLSFYNGQKASPIEVTAKNVVGPVIHLIIVIVVIIIIIIVVIIVIIIIIVILVWTTSLITLIARIIVSSSSATDLVGFCRTATIQGESIKLFCARAGPLSR